MINELKKLTLLTAIIGIAGAASCQQTNQTTENQKTNTGKKNGYLSQPLISNIYTAELYAQVFN